MRPRQWTLIARITTSILLAVAMNMGPLSVAQGTDPDEQEVYNYISQNLDVSSTSKALMRDCAQNLFRRDALQVRRRVEPQLLLAFLKIVNTDRRLSSVERTGIIQKIANPTGITASPCDPLTPPILWMISTVYEALAGPTYDADRTAKVLSTRYLVQTDIMTFLHQHTGIYPGVSVASPPAPGVLDALVRDISVVHISQGLENYVLGISTAAKAKDAATQAIALSMSVSIPPQRPDSPPGPRLDPAWVQIITAKVAALSDPEWESAAQTVCTRLKQIEPQRVKRC